MQTFRVLNHRKIIRKSLHNLSQERIAIHSQWRKGLHGESWQLTYWRDISSSKILFNAYDRCLAIFNGYRLRSNFLNYQWLDQSTRAACAQQSQPFLKLLIHQVSPVMLFFRVPNPPTIIDVSFRTLLSSEARFWYFERLFSLLVYRMHQYFHDVIVPL